MKGCELCGHPAGVYCDSDQASLCWDCDSKVHQANFLVAKHSRSLLCHICQMPTPWKASGPKFGPTVSVCNACSEKYDDDEKQGEFAEVDEQIRRGNGDSEDYDESDLQNQETESDDEEEVDGEDLVVPWSYTPCPTPIESSSNGEEDLSMSRSRVSSETAVAVSSRKHSLMDYEGNSEFTSTHLSHNTASMTMSYQTSRNDDANSSSSFRPLKKLIKNTEVTQSERNRYDSEAYSRAGTIISSLKKIENSMISGEGDASQVTLGISRINRCI